MAERTDSKQATARAEQMTSDEHAATLVVGADEDPWTPDELEEVRTELLSDASRLREEISDTETEIAELLKSGVDGGGEDPADTGTKAFEREHELSRAASHRETVLQIERALQRIDNGTYGICENCGNPIGKARLQAFPRATMCVTCKQQQERR
ncbi:TraR/DksA family transcriptional regulator [Actinobacteria bacterium YIM 96077]|uniref:Zinc finger DksA/TraR C4-type domain-containing protein n=1 Tax=Phytoactinopolyspora halophila TaxID=1981511 RepID=A0A329QV83_9ACTN|nr:TraR/DksA family transcriptional regulator [Phytoactinopolyspora halophila]AYY12853.1 TraR/DksA family transcriptional regulator [Actinobacteria bacterium YIM 96077]RAW16354.1 hypothetical protein DPM12_06870 [Phytoactinopolyspora halophila]